MITNRPKSNMEADTEASSEGREPQFSKFEERTEGMRLHFLHHDVRWDLEDNVRDEEDGERDVVPVAVQVQVFAQREKVSISDVHTTASVSLDLLKGVQFSNRSMNAMM